MPTETGDHRSIARFNGDRGKSMQRMRQTVPGLVMIIAIVGAAALLGCSDEIQPATVSDLNNRCFTFLNGAIFHPALADMPTTVTFTNSSTNFAIAPTCGSQLPAAVGISSVNPCVLAVTLSTYDPDTGPQAHDTITLNPCDFDSSNKTLIVGNGTISGISKPATPAPLER